MPKKHTTLFRIRDVLWYCTRLARVVLYVIVMSNNLFVLGANLDNVFAESKKSCQYLQNNPPPVRVTIRETAKKKANLKTPNSMAKMEEVIVL